MIAGSASRPSDPIRQRSSGEALFGQIALAAILGVGAIGFVCWAGAQLAAITSGRGVLPVGITQGGQAALDLPANAGRPALAWPASVRRLLPGPVAYWACTALVTVIIATLVGFAAWTCVRWKRHGAHPLGVKPNAGLARTSDLSALLVPEPQPGRLTLGHVGRRLVAAEPQASLAVVGPTGCGKTVGFAIPALLEWNGPIIATSVKNDLLDAALDHRKTRGTVWIYDPTNTSRQNTAQWSPLAACATWAGAMRVAAWLCEAAQPRTDNVNDGDYWYTQARKALAPYLHAGALGNKTMRDVARWIDTQEQDKVAETLREAGGVNEVLDRILATEPAIARRRALEAGARDAEIASVRDELLLHGGGGPRSWEMQEFALWPLDQQEQLNERIAAKITGQLRREYTGDAEEKLRGTGNIDALIAAQGLWKKEQRLRGSVFATIENVLSGYADPGVGQATESSEIELDCWLDGDNTIFVVATAHEQARLRPVLTVLVQQAIRAAYENANTNGGSLIKPCLVLLDEAGNIAPLRDLPTYASTARSHGITVVSIWQDLAQIRAIYGHQAQTLLNNHRAKLFGSGIADDATLEYVSRLIGDERHTEINHSDDLHGGRRSISEHTNYRRAAPADVLRRIQTNQALLVYGSELPAHVRLRPWYRARRPPDPRTDASCLLMQPAKPGE